MYYLSINWFLVKHCLSKLWKFCSYNVSTGQSPKIQILLQSQNEPAEGAELTGFLSSTSLMLRFSSGMIPLGSLSWTKTKMSMTQTTGTEQASWLRKSMLYSLWCTQSSTDSCLWGWTTSSSRFWLVPLWSRDSQIQRGSARDEEKETSTEAPGRAADRQTDVWADRQMTAPEDSFHPENHRHHSCRVFSSLGVFLFLYICWLSTPTFQLQVLAT